MGRFDPSATISHDYEATFDNPYLEFSYNTLKVIFALSPLILIAVLLMTSFDSSEEEEKKRHEKEKCGGGKCC
jgi:hypothetical protein